MDGKTLKAGAVAGLHHVKNPITLARAVMEKSPHVMMVGDGAEKFAKEQNIELVPKNISGRRNAGTLCKNHQTGKRKGKSRERRQKSQPIKFTGSELGTQNSKLAS